MASCFPGVGGGPSGRQVGGDSVDVRGTPQAGRSQRPEGGRPGTRAVFPTRNVGNKCCGQSTSSAMLSHVRTHAEGEMSLLSPHPDTPSCLNRWKSGSTIKLHDYTAPCRPVFCLSPWTLRYPPGSQCSWLWNEVTHRYLLMQGCKTRNACLYLKSPCLTHQMLFALIRVFKSIA